MKKELKNQMRVLGVDTSLRSSGVALVEASGLELKAVEYGVVRNPPAESLSGCLSRLYRAIKSRIEEGRPDVVAIEGVFYCKNVRTAVVLGEARGVIIASCALAGVPVYEYSPRRVKQSVVGFGGAGKEQVQKMVMAILGLREKPGEDEADALALAICHVHSVVRWSGDSGKAV